MAEPKKIHKYKKVPVYAGMEIAGGIRNYPIHKVAVDTIRQTFLIHEDGDMQQIEEVRIKREFIQSPPNKKVNKKYGKF